MRTALSYTLFPYTTLFRSGVKIEAVSAAGVVVAGFSVSDAKGRFNLRRLPDGEFKLRAAGVELNDGKVFAVSAAAPLFDLRSEEHTSELQSLTNLVCRLLL